MPPTLQELAEDTIAYLPPRPTFERIDRGDLVYVAGLSNATVHRQRLCDPRGAVDWSRTESRRRGIGEIEWWVGWNATPSDLGARLLELGLRPDEVPLLTGMTCDAPPPEAPGIEVRRVETAEDYLDAVQVDWDVWELTAEERVKRHDTEVLRFGPIHDSGVVHHWSAFADGKRVGFGRAIDMEAGVALMGGAVLPEARRRGVYRALVRARWDHAAQRGTPLLVVQAGALSAPVLAGIGFRRHGEVRLFVDRL